MSAPLMPAARTATSRSDAPGSGSACSLQVRRPSSSIVTACMGRTLRHYGRRMTDDALAFFDDDGEEVVLDRVEADALLGSVDGFDAAAVSACPRCRSRVLACV